MYTYNNKKNNIILLHLSKILGLSQDICFYFNNNNENIRFYLRDITQAYIKIASNLYPNFHIRLLSKVILELKISLDSMSRVMRLLYNKPKADKYQFAIYYLHYTEKPGITKSVYKSFFILTNAQAIITTYCLI